jgi:gluconate:H+ symporter, GntP family
MLLVLLAIVWIILSTRQFNLHPVWALLSACMIVGLGSGQSVAEVVSAITNGFGGLLGGIGLVIVFGAILGVVLERTGGAITLADGILRTLGKRYPGLAMGAIGSLVSIPVFCDSAFIVLSRINHALVGRTKVAAPTLFLSLAGGLYLTHNLVPPTPGPVAAAGNLGLSDQLGPIIVIGLAVSVPVLLLAWWWARKAGRNILLEGASAAYADADQELDGEREVETKKIPSIQRVLPVLIIPIFLLALGTLLPKGTTWRWVAIPEIALAIGVLLAFGLLGQPHRKQWRSWTETGISLAGPILVITGVGGSFGAVLKNTNVVSRATDWLGANQEQGWVLLLAAFALAAILKTAQGSSTSALVVGSSIFAPLLAGLDGLTIWQQSLMVTSLGAGAMVVSHANDSYFWVVTQFSGFKVADAYRSYTLMTLWMGLGTLVLCQLLFLLL